jgi:hypothetical protein
VGYLEGPEAVFTAFPYDGVVFIEYDRQAGFFKVALKDGSEHGTDIEAERQYSLLTEEWSNWMSR